MQLEVAAKNERRQKASDTLRLWQEERSKQCELRRQNNISMEQARHTEQGKDRQIDNKWERICKNCDLTSSLRPSGQDLSRMKTAMINRKNDMQGQATQF